jgi:hypothetical protein
MKNAKAVAVLLTLAAVARVAAESASLPPLPEKVVNFLKQAAPGMIAVLTIHGVPDLAHPWVNTPPELFKSYLQFLKDNRYTVIALRDLARFVDAKKALGTLAPAWEKAFK